MKRYEHFCSYDGGGPAEPVEAPDGEWVRLEDAAGSLRALADEVERLRAALTELRDRLKEHPAYAELTEEEEIDTGGDTAEFSYLARVADDALGA